MKPKAQGFFWLVLVCVAGLVSSGASGETYQRWFARLEIQVGQLRLVLDKILVALTNETKARQQVKEQIQKLRKDVTDLKAELQRKEAEEAKKSGIIEIRTQPPGATVVLGGVNKGVTPVVLNIVPGSHEITLNLINHLPQKQRIAVYGRGVYQVYSFSMVRRRIQIHNWTGGYAVYIAPGQFVHGGNTVTLTRAFWMMETEVTQGQYKSLIDPNPSHFTECGGNCPVEQVYWSDATKFANLLSEKEGLTSCYDTNGNVKIEYAGSKYYNCPGWRLPTEAEWEYAARAGTTGEYYGDINEIAWYNKNSDNKTHPVKKKQPNAWGLYDMLGNVWEWCYDLYSSTAPSGADYVYDSTGSPRVYRGGSWFYSSSYAAASLRISLSPSLRSTDVGFRLVRGAFVTSK